MKDSRRSSDDFYGRTDGNIKVIIPKMDVPATLGSDLKQPMKPGDYICVQVFVIRVYFNLNEAIFSFKLHIFC